jgi:hypothetical protein
MLLHEKEDKEALAWDLTEKGVATAARQRRVDGTRLSTSCSSVRSSFGTYVQCKRNSEMSLW